MRISLNQFMSVSFCAMLSLSAHAGTPQLNLDCKSGSTVISGFPRGEGYDLKVKIDNAMLQYTDQCQDAACTKSKIHGDLYVVDALDKNVFTIYFSMPSEIGDLFMGYFYALPGTVKYTKTARGYRAKYQGNYIGADPRSDASPKMFLDKPITLNCTQDEEL